MTAVALPIRSTSVVRLSAGRLLRLEMRRNAMLWMAPLALAVFWLDTYRNSMALAPLWGSRTLILQRGGALADLAPFVAAGAAWAGSRDGRRSTGEQVASTALPRWAARLAAWAASTCWALATYVICVGAVLGVTAWHGAAGVLLWWPIVVSAVGVTAVSALAFAAGVLFPSRFTAPLAVIVTYLALATQKISGTYVLINQQESPTYSLTAPVPDAGIFYPFLPDLSIVQTLFFAGLIIASLGALGFQAGPGTRRLRRAAASVTAAGLAATVAGLALVGTVRIQFNGAVIPALHDAANDRPLRYTPACSNVAIPICLNPAYRNNLPAVTAAVGPVLDELAGLPGAPVRVVQVGFWTRKRSGPDFGAATVSGTPATLSLPLPIGFEGSGWMGLGAPPADWPHRCCTSAQLWSSTTRVTEDVRPRVAVAAIDSVVGHAHPAQQAVAAGLLKALEVTLTAMPPGEPGPDTTTLIMPAPGTPGSAAAQRFAALTAAARQSWLRANLSALRSGQLSVEQVP